MKNFGNLKTLWKWCCTKLLSVAIMIAALSAFSCRSTKGTSTIEGADSLRWDKKVSVTLATIPSSLARMEIPIDSLRKLPEDAVYEKKEGKATVKASVKDGTLLVSASCDSLQALVYSQQEALVRIRDTLEQYESQKGPDVFTFWMQIKCYLTGALIGFTLTYFITKIRK
ncbi:hypothetical protein [Parabacteroides goldsteinii]|uniref:hypothetical protein n=1 Tax=Parabacteroides goldsteinii TaxID=328812 RepID=UPI00256ED945|nr:hypothetical protein [Parabacteroides goldsteinii]